MSGPRLRHGMLAVHAEGDAPGAPPVALHDELLPRRIDLAPAARALVPKLDGRPLAAALDAAAGEGHARASVEHSYRALRLLLAIEGAGAATVERLRRLRAREATCDPVFLPESRFACQGSGACCQSYSFGPLSRADLERLRGLDIAGKLPEAGPGPHVREVTSPWGQPQWYLSSRDERCVFLRDDRRCGLHVAFGPDAKPAICRLFPWHHQPTVFGLRVFDTGECASFPTSARTGPTLAEDLGRVLTLVPRETELHHPIVWLDERTPCDFAWFLALSDKLAHGVSLDTGSPGAALAAAGARAQAFVTALATAPLEDGEPERTVARELARWLVVPEPPGPAAFEAFASLALALAGAAEPAPGTSPDVLSCAHARIFQEGARLAAEHARARAEGRSVFEPLLDVDAQNVLRLSLRQQLFGAHVLVDGRPLAGLLRIAVALATTVAFARRTAATSPVPTAHLSAPHVAALRTLRTPAVVRALLDHPGAKWSTIAAAGALCG